MRHYANMAKIILVTSLMVGYAYLMEFFIAYYSGSPFERFHFANREFGNMWWAAGSCSRATRSCRTCSGSSGSGRTTGALMIADLSECVACGSSGL